MKKIIILLISVLLIGCTAIKDTSNDNDNKMTLKLAELTENEQKLVNFFSVDGKTVYLEYNVDDTVKSIKLKVYDLKGSDWETITASSMPIQGLNGKLLIHYENLSKGFKYMFDNETGTGTISWDIPDFSKEGTRSSETFSGETEIVLNEEIAIAQEVMTKQSSLATMNLKESIKNPDHYGKQAVEAVRILTITFSDSIELGESE